MEFAYIGSFTSKEWGGLEQGGISVFSRAQPDSDWEEIQVYERMNPSFLAFGSEKRTLYAAQGDGSKVAAFAIDGQTGLLHFLNERHVGFYNSVSVAVSPDGEFLLVACLNHGHGGVLSIRLLEDGSLGKLCDIQIPQGSHGPLYPAQVGTQPHQVRFDPAGRHLAVCDKGLDQIITYSLDECSGQLKQTHAVDFPMSCCPRHVCFHPKQDLAYLLTEWIGGVIACTYCGGVFTPIQMVRTTPDSFVGRRNVGAELEIHPTGKFLYASNRGHNSLVVYQICDDGRLAPLSWCSEGVDKPRFFTIAQDGKMLYCANEGSHCITAYAICEQTGTLTLVDTVMRASAPACILFRK